MPKGIPKNGINKGWFKQGQPSWNKNIPMREETKIKSSEAHQGHKLSEETKLKMKGRIPWNKNTKGVMPIPWNKDIIGKDSHAWIDGRSFEPYSVEFDKKLKRQIRERDDYTDQLTGQYGNIVHHIDYNKQNCNPKNLITLNRNNNSMVNFNRKYWQKYFNKLIRQIYAL